MKTALFIVCLAFSTTAFAADQGQQGKTTLKKTDRSALCNTPQGKLKKECSHATQTHN